MRDSALLPWRLGFKAGGVTAFSICPMCIKYKIAQDSSLQNISDIFPWKGDDDKEEIFDKYQPEPTH